MKTVDKKISDLISAEYNPRQLTKEQFDKLKDSLTRFGVVDPVIVNVNEERHNIIVGGHQRVRVWDEMGKTTIPCVEVDLTYDKERELNVRLNKNTGEWDWDELANNFDIGELVEWGFDEDDLAFEDDEENEEQEPEVEFSEYIGEANNYIVLIFDNEIDWLSAQTHFELKSVSSKRANGKPWSKGIGRVIRGDEYLRKVTA